jgi:glycosyltransferase involved in cell wall biosynthesis
VNLRVLSVAYPLAPVRPETAGGAEQVLLLLDRALIRAGHRSIVIACEGSAPQGELIATPRPPGVLDEATRQAVQERHRIAIEAVLQREKIDLIHMHGVDFDRYLPSSGVPLLITLHLPLGWYRPEALRLNRPRSYLHCVSASQRSAASAGITLSPDMENGVPTEELMIQITKRDLALSLGRICYEKGFHLAIDAARRAGIPFLLAGECFRYPAHERYFQEEIIPRLDGRRIRFLGPIGFKRKRRLLTAARCLLAPSLAPETGLLVAMEALACGTPVIAFPLGAAADLIEEGKTGFLVHDVAEMAEAIEACGDLDPEICRHAARTRFSSEQMIRRYFDLYQKLADGGLLEESARVTEAYLT